MGAFLIGTILLSLYMAGAVLLAALIRAYVLQYLWAWFVAPTFSLEPLSFVVAAGIVLAVMHLHYTSVALPALGKAKAKDDDDETPWSERRRDLKNSVLQLLMAQVILPFLILGVGWILKEAL